MSHLKERLEKNCLNCGVEVQGRYCQNCGQENVETRETVWHLIEHFFKDITHFDGKFFSTLKYLISKPGFVSKEYMIGRRASYVNPVRMYIFTSAFFFLIFFSLTDIDSNITVNEKTVNGLALATINQMDSTTFAEFTKTLDTANNKERKPMTREEFSTYLDKSIKKVGIHFTDEKYQTKEEYDSALSSGKVKHGWFTRQLVYKEIELNKKFKNNYADTFKSLISIFVHSLPQMFFILLPIFAFILHILYIRQKKFYYVNHGIFTIHYYIFSFIVGLAIFGLTLLNKELDWNAIIYIQLIMAFGVLFYLYKAMRKFYEQRRAKTVIKYLILCLSLLVALIVLFIFFLIFSLFKL